jgi:phosphoribosylglycinamide formyltransferase
MFHSHINRRLIGKVRLGTNLQALIDAQSSFDVKAEIVLVLSNRKAAYGLTRASNANPPIPTAYLAMQPWLKANPGKTRDDYDAEVARMVLNVQPDLVVLAGWMHVFGDGFLNLVSQPSSSSSVAQEPSSSSFPPDFRLPIPVINLHPALPGAFDGAHALDRAWDAYKEGKLDKTGVMVHRVVRQVDAGEPILVQEIPFEEGESKEQFEQRLHAVEWKVIVEATNIVLTQRHEQIQS